MFVERTPVTGEFQLFVNIEVLISENLHPGCSGDKEVQDLWRSLTNDAPLSNE